jgi:hypothetical protein
MPESNAELTPSVPETPSEPTTPETPAIETPDTPTPETPAAETPADTPPAETLYDLPDGRKVDAATLQKEWKENFLPDYTRKSQTLAEIQRAQNPPNLNNEPEWKKPDYVPKSYAEVIEIAKQEALREQSAQVQAAQARETALATEIDGQIAELKKADSTLDENALFQHANKYGFTNLKSAHANMVDLKKVAIETEQRVLKNVKTREADPVAVGSGGNTPSDDGYDPAVAGQFSSAVEYLQALKRK